MDKKPARASKTGSGSFSSTHRAFLSLLIFLGVVIGNLACGLILPREERPGELTPPRETFTPMPHTKAVPTPTEEIRPRVLWTQPLLIPPESQSGQVSDAFFVQEDKVFLTNLEGYPAAFDIATGGQLWQWEDRGTVYGVEPGTVYVVRLDKRLYALDAGTGETKWKTVFGVDESINVDRPLWIGTETVHLPFSMISFGMLRKGFASIDKRTGDILWWGNDRGNIRGLEIVALTGETLLAFFPYGDEPLVGFDPFTGEEKWVSSRRGSHFSESSFLSLSWGEGLSAFDIDSGAQLWQSGRTNIGEIIALSANRVYTLDRENNLVVLNRQTGEELWTWPEFGYQGYHFVGELEEGIAILGHENLGFTWGVDASTGNVLWENDDLRLNRLVGVSKETLIGVYNDPAGLNPPLLFGLDPETGNRKWRLELTQVTHKVIIFGDKLIYGRGEALAVLDPETGQLFSTVPLPGRPSRLFPQRDILLVQTGTPGYYGLQAGRGTISAIRP